MSNYFITYNWDLAEKLNGWILSCVMQPENLPEPTADQLRRFEHARSPASFLSDEQWEALKGNVVALLFDGHDKGKVIAVAPIDFDLPRTHRESLQAQVQNSIYKDRRYMIYQILKEDPEGPIAKNG